MKRILVTGGAGFIGSQLVWKLSELNNHVLVIDDLSVGKIKLLPSFNKEIQFLKCDITDKTILANVLEKFKPEIVVHLAAIHFIPYCNKYPWRTLKVNVMGTRNLFEWCFNVKPDILFFASSAAVYPISNKANSENFSVSPPDIYGLTKVIGEDIAKLFHRETGIRTIVGRFFNVFGSNETNPHLIPEIINQVRLGKRKISLGNLEPKRDYIHVKDVVAAITTLLNKFQGGFDIFNIGSGKEYSVKQVIQYIQESLGEKIEIVQDKNRMRKSDRLHLLADISKIQAKTNWKPQWTLQEGIKELIRK